MDELEEVCIDERDTTKVIRIRKNLEATVRTRLVEFLRRNSDVFAWSHKDMVGISPTVISHVLNIDKNHPPVRQKRRLLDKERSKALKEEVERLKENGFIRETYYPAWVSNPVLVPNPNGKWRTCIDFTDLNKACPKDCFPLPRIDQLVDATSGHEILSFMDAY